MISRNIDITLYTATALATTLDMRDVQYGLLSFATMSTNATTLAIYGAHASDQTFRQLYKADGNAITITMAPSTTVGRMYPLPDEAKAAQYVKVVSNDTNSTGVSGVVMFKG